ncbi:ABC transporter permease [Neomicrococcus lactis]|uniref:ABC transporter permease n=1 Tax=Neomicrococcus lactis TaxID=732241 RepID=UPI002301B4B3|nr:ABC transporter permease subunit [Neomicrococcus lactis]
MKRSEKRQRNQAIFRWIVLGLVLIFMLYPLYALFEFSIRFPLTGAYDWSSWTRLFDGSQSRLTPLRNGFVNSLVIALITVAIMLALLIPTMVWVRLRVPRIKRWVEFICLLPLTIPAVVLVVGLAPVYRFISIHVLDTNAIWLAFAYVILVLPFSYRALDAGLSSIDVKTLSETARSFGASWFTVLWRVILPNIRTAIASASFIAVAVVLGEFTIARLLNRETLQTGVFLVNQADPQVAAAVSLMVLLFGVVLLVGLGLLYRGGRRRSRPAVSASASSTTPQLTSPATLTDPAPAASASLPSSTQQKDAS